VLFGEQALFADNPRSATAQTKNDGVVVAIQGKQFREWIAQDKDNGLKLLMGMLQNTSHAFARPVMNSRLFMGSAGYWPWRNRSVSASGSSGVSEEQSAQVDEIILYQRSPYWEEFQPCGHPPTDNRPALPAQHALMSKVVAATGLWSLNDPRNPGNAAAAIVPLLNRESENQPLLGFLWLASKSYPEVLPPIGCFCSLLCPFNSPMPSFCSIAMRIRRPKPDFSKAVARSLSDLGLYLIPSAILQALKQHLGITMTAYKQLKHIYK